VDRELKNVNQIAMSDDKNLSGEEKRRLLKEEYKRELLARKEFLGKVKNLKQSQKIQKALSEMQPQDDTDEWTDRLNQETALSEARLDVALDSATTQKEKIQRIEDEVEIQKLAAKDLVFQMKKELGLLTDEEIEAAKKPKVEAAAEEVKAESAEGEETAIDVEKIEKKPSSKSPDKSMGDY
jgi:hypothetical protein